MTPLKFYIDTTSLAYPFVSDTMLGGKTISITLPPDKKSAIFVQQSIDGTKWTSKQSITITNNVRFHVPATKTTMLRLLVSVMPLSASYEDFNFIGGGQGSVQSVNNIKPDENGNVQIDVGHGMKQVLLSFEKYKALPETDSNTMYLIINEDEDDEGR